jgi:hypothetical protein
MLRSFYDQSSPPNCWNSSPPVEACPPTVRGKEDRHGQAWQTLALPAVSMSADRNPRYRGHTKQDSADMSVSLPSSLHRQAIQAGEVRINTIVGWTARQ